MIGAKSRGVDIEDWGICQIVADPIRDACEGEAKLWFELVAKVGSKTDKDDSDELFHGTGKRLENINDRRSGGG